jgi:hypothetical protein
MVSQNIKASNKSITAYRIAAGQDFVQPAVERIVFPAIHRRPRGAVLSALFTSDDTVSPSGGRRRFLAMPAALLPGESALRQFAIL